MRLKRVGKNAKVADSLTDSILSCQFLICRSLFILLCISFDALDIKFPPAYANGIPGAGFLLMITMRVNSNPLVIAQALFCQSDQYGELYIYELYIFF
jgi:hypothetical protein